jgi:hypothetical protein
VQSQRLVRKGPFRSPSDGERNGPLTGLETDGHVGTKAAPSVFAGRVKPSLDYLDQIDINYRDHSHLRRQLGPASPSTSDGKCCRSDRAASGYLRLAALHVLWLRPKQVPIMGETELMIGQPKIR